MNGTIVSRREVQARWSFAEVTGRNAEIYRAQHADPASRDLQDKIVGGCAYESLSWAEKDLLASWMDAGYRKDFANAFRWYDSFRCESWTKERLLRLRSLPVLDPAKQRRKVPLLTFLTSPRGNNPKDARVAADLVPVTTPFEQRQPLVVGHWDDGEEVLWEGYFRAALFARSPDPDALILVWVPHEGWWPRKA